MICFQPSIGKNISSILNDMGGGGGGGREREKSAVILMTLGKKLAVILLTL